INVFDGQMVMADIPGIIEGANEGVGLGHDFLRHVERTRLLMHVVDISGCEGRNPIDDFKLINNELQKYSEQLSNKLQIVVANKIDVSDMYLEEFKKFIESLGLELFVISAYAKKGTEELIKRAYTLLKDIPVPVFEAEAAPEPEPVTIDTSFEIEIDDEVYVITGESIELLVNSTNFDDTESVSYFQRMLRKSGIITKLEEMGINDGDTVRINDLEFDYYR
ncbi:MAG: Obg family GTPase CgtA, partial [Clostridia bacterium]|nr:Obg family GTPase CgtA [Clostridia bacterium]